MRKRITYVAEWNEEGRYYRVAEKGWRSLTGHFWMNDDGSCPEGREIHDCKIKLKGGERHGALLDR